MNPDLYALMRPRRVCLCRNVSKEDLIDAVENGAHTLEKLILKTKASTGCGSCLGEVTKILNERTALLRLQKDPKQRNFFELEAETSNKKK